MNGVETIDFKENTIIGENAGSLARALICADILNAKLRDDSIRREGPIIIRDSIIVGHIDLHGLRLERDLHFLNCLFYHSIVAIGFHGHSLFLDECCLISGLDARDMRLAGNLFLRRGFVSYGPVLIRDAIVERIVDCRNAHFLFTGDTTELILAEALDREHENQAFGASRCRIGTLFWENVNLDGPLSFRNAKVDTLRDDIAHAGARSWGAPNVDLLGFEFKEKNPADFGSHRMWLEIDFSSAHGRSIQISRWLELNGQPDQAHKLLLWSRRNGLDGLDGLDAKIRSLYLTFIALSFNPIMIFSLLCVLFILFSISAYFMWGFGAITPSSVAVLSDPCYLASYPCNKTNWQNPIFANMIYRLPVAYPTFDPFSYALEKSFPFFVTAGQSYWSNNSPLVVIELLYTSMSLALQGLLVWCFAGRRSISHV